MACWRGFLTTLVFCSALLFGNERTASANGPVRVYFDNFDDSPIASHGVAASWSGYYHVESSQGFAGLGNGTNLVSGGFLHNPTGDNFTNMPSLHSVLTLTNLPHHDAFDLNFLAAIIDTWDGGSPSESCCPDIFFVSVDGETWFAESFANMPNGQSYVAPPNVTITLRSRLGFDTFDDSLYDLGQDATFDLIPHTADSLTIEWWAGGRGWNRPANESWAIDNLEVLLRGVPVPEPPTLGLFFMATCAWIVVRLARLAT